mmetsp:Transcript_13256/g.20139  ORF Transcript_13256/g.20139 Transcript_13256/m.20139 type:complete len:181 (-) Transcript_13256:384-926(-)
MPTPSPTAALPEDVQWAIIVGLSFGIGLASFFAIFPGTTYDDDNTSPSAAVEPTSLQQADEMQNSTKEKDDSHTERDKRRKEMREKRIAKLVDKLGMSEENARETVEEIEKQISNPPQNQEAQDPSFSFTQKADLIVYFLLFSVLLYISVRDYRGGPIRGIARILTRLFPREAETLGLEL